MKKLTSMILSLVLLCAIFAPCSVYADAVQPLTEIGEIEADKKAGYEIRFVYEGEEYSIDYTEMDEEGLEYVLDVFSDDNLVLCENQDDYVPEGGYFDPVSKDDNINWFFAFDENKVHVTAAYPIEDGYYEGLFEYKDEKVYDELIEYLYALVKEEKQEEEPTEEPTEKPTEKEDTRENLVNITDFDVIYSGEFYIEDFDDYFEWGVCSYKREGEKKNVTVFYFKYGETKDEEYLFVSDEIYEDTNTVIFDLTNKEGRQVTLQKDAGVEFDQTVNYNYDYEIQVNVAENMKTESVVVSYKHKTENKFTDEIIDMEDYEESGKLPSDLFDRKNNVKVADKPVEKTEEKKEEVKKEETEFDVDEWIEDVVSEMTAESYITVGATSKKYYFGHEFGLNNENLAEQKAVVEKFLKMIFAMSDKAVYYEECDCRKTSYDHVFNCTINIDGFKTYNISIKDEHMSFLGERYYVNNTPKILEYVVSLWDDDFKVFDCESRKDLKESDDYTGKMDFENSQFVSDNGTTKAFKYREKIEFDIKLDKSFEETVFEEYVKIGEEVHCTIQNLWSGSMFFVLTIEGSKGTGQYWANVRSSSLGGGFSGSETGRVLRFLTVNKVDDDVMKVYDRMPMEQYATIEVQGSLENDDVAGVSIQWKPYQLSSNNAVANINPSNSLEGYNIDYEYYGTEDELKDGRNLYTLFGINEKDIEIQKDVAEFKTFEEKANVLNEMGLFKGTDKGYELEKVLTREEAAVLLVRLAGGEEGLSDNDYEEKFSDVPQSEWSFDYVMFCYENGITKGTGETTFSPDDMISADQFVTLILRLLGYTDANPDTALGRAVNMGIIDEYDAKRYEQSSIFTRGDAVYIMYNCLEAETADGKLFKDVLVI